MGRRVYGIKVVKNGSQVYVRLLGRNDRGQKSLIAHAAGIAAADGKKTSVQLLEEMLLIVKEP